MPALRMALRHRELALKRNDLWRSRSPHHIPERRLARRRRDAHSGRPAVHIVGDVDALRMARQRFNAARLRLRKQRMIHQTVLLQNRFHRPRAAPEPERVDRQNRNLVAVRMLGPPNVVPQPAQPRPRQMHRHVIRRVRQRPAEVPGLRVIPQQHQRHAGHVADVFETLPIKGHGQIFNWRQ
jgi:hypothetical protein